MSDVRYARDGPTCGYISARARKTAGHLFQSEGSSANGAYRGEAGVVLVRIKPKKIAISMVISLICLAHRKIVQSFTDEELISTKCDLWSSLLPLLLPFRKSLLRPDKYTSTSVAS